MHDVKCLRFLAEAASLPSHHDFGGVDPLLQCRQLNHVTLYYCRDGNKALENIPKCPALTFYNENWFCITNICLNGDKPIVSYDRIFLFITWIVVILRHFMDKSYLSVHEGNLCYFSYSCLISLLRNKGLGEQI